LLLLVVLVGGASGTYVATRSTASTTTSTTSTTVPPTTSTTLAPNPSFTLSAVGDTDLGDTPQLPSDPVAYFAPVKAALAADVVFGNLEGTMTNAGSSKCGPTSTECYAFRVPPSFAQVYRSTGFTVLNSANNHSYDFGATGEADTSAALRAAGIVQAGLPGQIGVVHTHGVRVAFVDFAPYALTNDMLNFTQAAQLIAQAKREAQVVVVYMHAGAEGTTADHVTRATEIYFGENRGNPYEFAHAAIDDGADLVIASGPHVLRGMEWYRGHLIAYSLGDFTNYDAFASVGDLSLSAILHVSMNARGVLESASVTPIAISSGGQAVFDPTHATWGFMNELSTQDFGATAALIGATGQVRVPRGA
jgi:poly-gamma-glutamate capsule biosynthesis protein CapA/YwtB (metallophosphatase superfamily)